MLQTPEGSGRMSADVRCKCVRLWQAAIQKRHGGTGALWACRIFLGVGRLHPKVYYNTVHPIHAYIRTATYCTDTELKCKLQVIRAKRDTNRAPCSQTVT